ncbi:hypothetical protein K435DRAFT_784377 [Dendrothele bispora CBS 962.96]|uniref:Uncharacterized protein n=1 Tax=Dendrothele bispora (strain CBS 962.96) TaxID=1314807 RepID=A0A4S8L3I0_DENBC|nr:hypothetical protein K435DRAFT_784377 [Dendrothele bispora CBS 962.96]
MIEITKFNLLKHYATARDSAFQKTTVLSAFEKTGIWPFNRSAIPASAYEPSKNSTTRSAQPIPARLAPTFVPTPSTSSASADSEAIQLHIPIPAKLPKDASKKALQVQNEELRNIVGDASHEMSKAYGQMKLMDHENELLRQQLFAKDQKRGKKAVNSNGPRLMTSGAMLDELAKGVWAQLISEVHKEAKPKFRIARAVIAEHEKQEETERKAREKAEKAKEKARLKEARAQEEAKKREEKRKMLKEERERKRKEKVTQVSRGRRTKRGHGRGRGAVPGASISDDNDSDTGGKPDQRSGGRGRGSVRGRVRGRGRGQRGRGRGRVQTNVQTQTQPQPQPRPRPRPNYKQTEPAVPSTLEEIEPTNIIHTVNTEVWGGCDVLHFVG